MKRIIYVAILIQTTFVACTSKKEDVLEEKSHLITITKEQFSQGDMTFGAADFMAFKRSFQFTGKIVPEANAVANVSAPVDGLIKNVFRQEGQWLEAGDVIFELGGNTFIELQQSFATSAAKLPQLRADYDRLKILYEENIKTESEFMSAESAFKSELAVYGALKMKLQNLGLNTSLIENGDYAPSYKIKSPIKGQLNNINASLGQFVSSQQTIAEIINAEKKMLKLIVFERDFSNIKLGQDVYFRSASEKDMNSHARIMHKGQVLNAKSNSFDCFASISGADQDKFIINQLVRGEIILQTDTVKAVPEAAIINDGNSNYVLVKEGEKDGSYLLDKLKVNVGRANKNFVELVGFSSKKEILISGAYHIGF